MRGGMGRGTGRHRERERGETGGMESEWRAESWGREGREESEGREEGGYPKNIRKSINI